MSMTLKINGRLLKAESGQTILETARAHGIEIPTLCDYPGLPPHGSCRLCIVEIQGRPTTPTACTTPVEAGMVVETDTAELRELRNDILRMLLAEHPGGCLFCPENQHCEECMVTLRKAGVTTGCRSCPADRQCSLQSMVEQSSLQSTAYPVRYRALQVEKGDPFFDRDYNLCVLCGRCFRVCESLHFNNIPTYVKRGSDTRVGTSFGQSYLGAGCSFCGACVEACPTGALSEKTIKWARKPDGEVRSVCPFCSLACETKLLTRDGAVIGVLSGENTPALCVKGRFCVPEIVNHPDRLKKVQRIENGEAVSSTWIEACQAAAERLSACAPQDFALVISASCSNEDLFVAKKFANQVMGSASAYLSTTRYGKRLDAASRLLAHSLPLDQLDSADLIFYLGLDAKYSQSVVEKYLLRARERGAAIITLNAREHVPGRFADLWLKPLPGQEGEMLARLTSGNLYDGVVGEALRLLDEAVNPILVAGPDFLANLPEAVGDLQASTGAPLVALAAESNLAGALKVGFGGARSTPPPRILYLIGTALPQNLNEEPFVLVQNTHHLEGERNLSIREGLTLPMAAFSEAGGSLMDQSGKVKILSAAVPPPGDALPGWEILCRIAQAMEKPGFEYSSPAEIRAEMSARPAEKIEMIGTPDWLAPTGKHDFLGAPLERWAEGLRELGLTPQEEEQYVPLAGE